MPNDYFRFREFTIQQRRSAMKVCTDACLFGAWTVRHLQDENKILDIGTGTGLLSLMIAQKSSAFLDAIEYDHDSFSEAKENIKASPYPEQIKIIEDDVRRYPFKNDYDFIVTNPPFFETDLQSTEKNKNLAKHSISLSLRELIVVVDQILKPTGSLSILLPFHRSDYFKKLAFEFGFSPQEETTIRQTEHHLPFRIMAIYSRNSPKPAVHSEIIIKNDGNYSEEFSLLLKDYYEDNAFRKKLNF
jgi:tRNA1Val (adenine37-N6)-methyltransferase